MFGLGAPEIIIVFTILIVICIGILPQIFFLLTLQKLLSKCSVQNRTIEPSLVWLFLIPLFSFYWCFHLVKHINTTLQNEFHGSPNIYLEIKSLHTFGIAMSVLFVSTLVPYLGFLTALAYLVLWILYWIKIAKISSYLPLATSQLDTNANIGKQGSASKSNRTIEQPAELKKKEILDEKSIEKGLVSLKSKDYNDAIAWFTRAIDNRFDSANAYYYRAIAYSKLSDKKNLLNDLQKSAKLGHGKAIGQLKKIMPVEVSKI